MKTRNIGILAHADAGKTTIAEYLLHRCGAVQQRGSVDEGTAHTDTLAVERRRGISVRACAASFVHGDSYITLVDTPGHADFAAEVERAIWAIDGAVLVVSAVEGVQAQTELYFNALRKAMPKKEKLCCFLGGLAAPVLNTAFFMGFLVLIFYNCEYVQNLAGTLGATNAFMFIVLLVGVQAIFEWVICCLVAGAVSLPVRKYLKMN